MSNQLKHLHQLIVKHYNLEELKTLCLQLAINHENLSGNTLDSKARELILMMGRQNKLDRLLTELRQSDTPIPALANFQLDSVTLEKAIRSFEKTIPRPLRFKFEITFGIVITVFVAIILFRVANLGGNTFKADLGGGQVGGSVTQVGGDATVYNLSFVTEQAAEFSSEALSEETLEMMAQATKFLKEEKYSEAIPLLQSIAEEASAPSVYNNLGVSYLAIGEPEQAREAFEQALSIDPSDAVILENLSKLPHDRIEDVQVVSYSSRGPSCWPTSLIDDGNGTWCSRDGNLPQAFVIQLPREHLVSQVIFDNSPSGDTTKDTKEVRVSFSLEGEGIGYQEIGVFTLNQAEISQGFKIDPPMYTRWIKVDILSNYGSPEHTRLMEFRVIGQIRVNGE